MIKAFDKQNLKTLRAEMEAALAVAAQNHGIKIVVGAARFTSDNTTFKVDLSTTSTDGSVNTKSASDFKRYATSYGLKPEHLGVTFTHGGEQYRLDGMTSGRSYKYPFLATRLSDGKQYKIPESALRTLQSKDFKPLFGAAPVTPKGTCSNEHAFDMSTGKPLGKCQKPATTTRKGLGRTSQPLPYCADCANLIDESRREMAAEARMS